MMGIVSSGNPTGLKLFCDVTKWRWLNPINTLYMLTRVKTRPRYLNTEVCYQGSLKQLLQVHSCRSGSPSPSPVLEVVLRSVCTWVCSPRIRSCACSKFSFNRLIWHCMRHWIYIRIQMLYSAQAYSPTIALRRQLIYSTTSSTNCNPILISVSFP